MGRISSSVGLVSGINTASIIDQLMSLEEQPKTALQDRIDIINKQKLAFAGLQTQLASLKLVGTTLKKPSTFQTATAASSNENVLTATTGPGAVPGDYQFQVARLVTTQQAISNGFSDYTAAKVGAGSLTVELGGGDLTSTNTLDSLNGGNGVRRGVFRISDRSGRTAVIDISSAVSLDDVVKKINTSLDVSVKASIKGQGLVLQDTSGGSGNFMIQDIGDGQTAADLGIVATTATAKITGTAINVLGRGTGVTQLNDGHGVRNTGNSVLPDFSITASDGTTASIALAGKNTVGDIVDAINTAGTGKFHAVINTTTNAIQLVDDSGGAGSFQVTALNGSKAATDLGLLQPAVGGTISGRTILSALGTVSINSLNGGNGLTLGTIKITDRAGGVANAIDLSGASSVQDVLDTINAAGIGVTAGLNDSGNGIKITDTSGGAGNLVIEDVSGTSAVDFGLAGTYTPGKNTVSGANLQRQWVSENTLLSSYNGGKGVALGHFTITNPNAVGVAKSATIDLTSGNPTKIGDVISRINSAGIGVTASINAHGDGILLHDATGGASHISVAEVDGTTAHDLNIFGTATGADIDGSFEKTIALDATDTLSTVQTKINNLNWGLSASIINDGSAGAPFHLSLTAKNSGIAGRVVFDTGATEISTSKLIDAQDAAVFVGSATAAKPLLITSSHNQINGILPGVNIDLHSTSSQPVDLSITRSPDKIVDQINTFVTNFNTVIDSLNDLGKFDPSTGEKGLLLGDSTLQQIQQDLYTSVTSAVKFAGNNGSSMPFKVLSDVGLTIDGNAHLTFDEDKFRSQFGKDPDATQKLFTAFEQKTTVTPKGATSGNVTYTPYGTATYTDLNGLTDSVTGTNTKVELAGRGIGYVIENIMNKLVDPVSGVIPVENQTLDGRVTQFQQRITDMDALIAQKRTRLETQFAQMETVLAGLQSQGQALSSLTGISYSNTSSSSSSSSNKSN